MRQVVIVILAVGLGGCVTGAQTTKLAHVDSRDSATVVADITAAEQRWAAALVTQDTVTLQQLLAPEFALTLSAAPAAPLPRERWLASVPAYLTHSLDICELQVRVLRPDVAVASFIANLKATVRGEDRSGMFFITDVWIRTDGNWQVVARYSSKPEGATASAQALAGARAECTPR